MEEEEKDEEVLCLVFPGKNSYDNDGAATTAPRRHLFHPVWKTLAAKIINGEKCPFSLQPKNMKKDNEPKKQKENNNERMEQK